jgi:hypothetical protein
MARGDDPQMLVCNRLADMVKMHPDQDDTHKCGSCGHAVGIYPSGQKAIKRWPKIAIRCAQCAQISSLPTDINIPAAQTYEEFAQEARDSKPVVRQ